MIVGLDVRPALFGCTGFGRTVRETWRALSARGDVEVRGFGAAWRRPRSGGALAGGRAPRLPARLQQALAPLGFGVESVLGAVDVYHHTDLVFAPVRRAPQVLTVYDLVFLRDRTWHEPGFARRVMRRLRPRAAAARRIVVPCERVAEDVRRNGLGSPDRVVVAPLGADHVDPTPRPDDAERTARLLAAAGLPDDGRPVVLVPGTREPRKNQRALVEAFVGGAARGPAASMLLVGPPGWGCAALEARLVALRGGRGARAVGVAGEVTEEDLAALYRSVELVAYPSFAEGFGLPVVEALRCGRPVLTASGTPMADTGGDAVLAVDPYDRGAIARGLERLLADDALRADLAARGPDRAAPLTWRSHTDVLTDVYRAALS